MIQLMGDQVVRFQEESAAFDEVAAQILALHRSDLACMTILLFGGAASVDQLTAALHVPRGAVTATVERLQLAELRGLHRLMCAAFGPEAVAVLREAGVEYRLQHLQDCLLDQPVKHTRYAY